MVNKALASKFCGEVLNPPRPVYEEPAQFVVRNIMLSLGRDLWGGGSRKCSPN